MNLPAVAHEMKSAQDLCTQIAPFAARVSGFDSAAAYEVPRLIHEARIQEGAVPVGRKIGFTNRDMWFEHGVHEPIWAYVYDTTVARLSGPRSAHRVGRFTEPRIEPEIVLHFRSAPAVSDDPASVLACIDRIALLITADPPHDVRRERLQGASAVRGASIGHSHGALARLDADFTSLARIRGLPLAA